MVHEDSQIISAAMTTIARSLAARFSYRVAMAHHCLNRLTHLSATLRFH